MMATSGGGSLNYPNINELRQRLYFTERGLEKLNFLETEEHIAEDEPGYIPAPASPEHINTLTVDDLSPSTPQVTPIKPIPQGNALASSTPKKMAARGRTSAGSRIASQELSSSRESGQRSYGSQGSNVTDNVPNQELRIISGESNQRSYGPHRSNVMDNVADQFSGSSIDDENEELRQKLHSQRRVNAELTADNHDLLNKMESQSHQQHQYKQQMVQLLQQLQDHDSAVTEIKHALAERDENIERLQVELRKVHGEMMTVGGSNRDLTTELESQLQKSIDLTQHFGMLKTELVTTQKLKEKAERECERALQAAENMQKSVEDYHHRSMEKNYQQESAEAQLTQRLGESQESQRILQRQAEAGAAEMVDLREEIRRFEEENGSERAARMSAEQQNVELRIQVSKLSTKIGRPDVKTPVDLDLQRKNENLQRQLSQVTQALEQSNTSLGQTEAKLSHVLSCQASMDNSVRGKSTEDGTSSLVQELREDLAVREQEVHVLTLRLGNREAYEQEATDSSLMQTRASKDKLERRVDDLELLVSSLEEERGRHTSRLLLLEEQNTELELQTSSLRAKLEHKSKQADGLQVELRDVNSETVTLERQLHKSETEAGRLQRQLDQHAMETKQLNKQSSQLQKQLLEQSDEMQALNSEISSLRSRLTGLEDERQQHENNNEAHLKNAQSKITQLTGELTERDEELHKTLSDMDRVAQDLNAKEMAVMDMQQELKLARIDSEKALQSVEQRGLLAMSQVQELQAALTVCKQELQIYVDQLDQSKVDYDLDLNQKLHRIAELEQESSTLRETLTSRDLHITDVEKQLCKGKDVLQMSSEKLMQMEQRQCKLQAKVSSLEQQASQDKKSFSEERQTLQQEIQTTHDKLQTACETLSSNQEELRDRDAQIQILQRDLVSAEQDSDDLRAQLDDTQTDINQLEEQLSQLDQQLGESRTELRNHKNQVDGLEDELAKQHDEMEEKNKVTADLRSQLHDQGVRLSQLKTELDASRGQHQTEADDLRQLDEKLSEKSRQFTTINNKYSAQQESLQHKQAEIEQLYTTLQQQQYQIQQRSSQVTQLDVILKEHRYDTDQRLSALETALKKSQLEAQQRSKQVSVLDEQVGLLKTELREKELLLEESTKSCSRQQQQLHSSSDNITALQQEVNELKTKLVKVKEENTELQKELDVTREEEHRLQGELTEAQCESSLHLRQGDRLNTQLQEAIERYQAQEGNAACLAEALELLNTQKIQLESQHDAAKRHLQREVGEIQTNYQQQLENLRRETSHVADKLHDEQKELRKELDQAKQTEHHLVLELETTRAEFEVQSKELTSAKGAVQNANSGIWGKINEVAQLQSKISGLQEPTKPLPYTSRMSANLTTGGASQQHSHNRPPQRQAENLKYTAQLPPELDDTLVGGPHEVRFEDSQKASQQKSSHSYPVVSQDFHNSYPPAAVNVPNRPSTADSEGPAMASHLTSLSISDISRADSSAVRYVVSESDDPDSLQSMLRDVQKMCSQNISDACASSVGQGATQAGSDRFFGVKAWPYGRNGAPDRVTAGKKPSKNSSDGAKTQGSIVTGKKNTKMTDLRKNKGPLHSSPHSRRTKTIFATKPQAPGRRNTKPTDHNTNNNNNSSSSSDPHPNDNEPTKDTNTRKSKLKTKSPLHPEHSPNVSTAISHYSEELPIQLSKDADVHPELGKPSNMCIKTQGDLDLAERRKALTAMQRELESQLLAVDEHLATTELS